MGCLLFHWTRGSILSYVCQSYPLQFHLWQLQFQFGTGHFGHPCTHGTPDIDGIWSIPYHFFRILMARLSQGELSNGDHIQKQRVIEHLTI